MINLDVHINHYVTGEMSFRYHDICVYFLEVDLQETCYLNIFMTVVYITIKCNGIIHTAPYAHTQKYLKLINLYYIRTTQKKYIIKHFLDIIKTLVCVC